MFIGYYIVAIDVLHKAQEEPFHSCSVTIDDTHVLCWARFQDSGHEARFCAREGVEALPDVRESKPISDAHAQKLSKFGVKQGHSLMDVSSALEQSIGRCMRLPHA